MKKTKVVLGLMILGIIFATGTTAYAKEVDGSLINNQGVTITAEEYKRLENLGFTEKQVENMTQEEFDNNKDLIGEVVSTETVYMKNIDGKEEQVSEEEYNLPGISLFGMQVGYVETGAKKMTTQIISVSGRYRYKVDLEWKSMPKVRSYDILGIGMDSNVSIYTNVYFQQTFCYTTGICENSTVHAKKNTSSGGAASFKIPSASNMNYLASYLYYDVVKNTSSTITQLNAYGDYSHATKTISEDDAMKYRITTAGIVLDSAISTYYDSISYAKAIWTGSW